MPLAKAYAVGLVGLDGHLVEVEADLAPGLPGLTVIGLPDAALAEARDRVRAAIVNTGFSWPSRRITLALSPAWLPKRGSGFDLALAASVLAADGRLPAAALHDRVLLGELGLDGRVRPVRGVLPAALTARAEGVERLVVPLENLAEARLLPGITARGVGSCVTWCTCSPARTTTRRRLPSPSGCRWSHPTWVTSSARCPERTAVEVAAAGGHHALLVGPPGSGKTMLAERLPGLLPPLTLEEALEVTAVHSVAGALPDGEPLVELPPFQDPHHTATVAVDRRRWQRDRPTGRRLARAPRRAVPRRGAGVLDPRARRPAAAARERSADASPASAGRRSTRRRSRCCWPRTRARAPRPTTRCSCPPDARRRYLARLSGPLLDRIDMHVAVPAITRAEMLADTGHAETTAVVAARVRGRAARAPRRYAGTPWRTNGQVPPVELRRRWPVPRSSCADADRALELGALTARGYGRVLRLAWTLADLAEVDVPGREHVGHALHVPARARAAGALAA